MSSNLFEALSQMEGLIKNKMNPLDAKFVALVNSLKDKYDAMETLAKQIDQHTPENREELEKQIIFMASETLSMTMEMKVIQDQKNEFMTQLDELTKQLPVLMQ